MKILIPFLFFFASPVFGQNSGDQLYLVERQSYPSWGTYSLPQFMDKYQPALYFPFNQFDAEFYKMKKVKQIRLHARNGYRMYHCDLDENGEIKEWGYYKGDGYYVTNKIILLEGKNTLTVCKLLLGDEIIKSDSVYQFHHTYNNADTSIHLSYQVRIIHINGNLINRRNAHYNENYLGKPDRNPLAFYQTPTFSLFDGSTDTIKPEKYSPPNFYDVAFKTDYDSNQLYLTEHSIIFNNRVYYVGDEEKDLAEIHQHFLFSDIPMSENKMYFVEGEYFCERTETHEFYPCTLDYGTPSWDHDASAYKNGFTLRVEDSLYESFYWGHYPLDKSPEAIRENEVNDSIAKANYDLNPNVVKDAFGNYNRRPLVFPKKQKYLVHDTRYCYEYLFFD